MRILHTSDWHIGRSFHGHSTLEALAGVLDEMVAQVHARGVDVVIIAGDIFDSSTPAAGCYPLLSDTLAALRAAGARVIVTSGNHDSAARLGFQSSLLRDGIHVLTDPAGLATPVTVHDADGPVHIYGIPYLEPTIVRHLWDGAELRTQEQAMSWAMNLVRADLDERGGRSVAVAHCFAAGVEPTPHLERDIQQGGLDVVPLATFDGMDYVALGHIHGRQTLSDAVRYPGAPLHYSFGEGDKPRGSWLVEFDASGLASVEWLALSIPRELETIRGTLDELLHDDRFADSTSKWVCAQYTDDTPQLDPMRRLQQRFPHCATVSHAPEGQRQSDLLTYVDRVRRARNPLELFDAFLTHVREGEGASAAESELIREVVEERVAAEARA